MSAFWRRNVLLPAMLGPVSSHSRRPASSAQSLATKPGPCALAERRLDHGMAAADDLEARPVLDLRPAIALLRCQLGEPRRHVERGERRGRARDRLGARHRLADQVLEAV